MRLLPVLAVLGHLALVSAFALRWRTWWELTATGDAGAALVLVTVLAGVLGGIRTTVAVVLSGLAWGLSLVSATAASAVGRCAFRVSPALLRGSLLLPTAAVIALGVGSPANAVIPSPAWPTSGFTAPHQSEPREPAPPTDGVPSPAWPVTDATVPSVDPEAEAADRVPTDDDAPASPAAPEVTVHTVTRGESLWSIARERGAHGVQHTAAAVDALHRANAEVVGADPDLLLPGAVLTIPTDLASHSGTGPAPDGARS